MADQAILDRLRELAEAGKAGGWQEVCAALDMGDIILGLSDRGAVKAAQEATGMHRSTLWRRAKLAEHRDVVERERPANLTDALRLVQRIEAEAAAGEGEGEDEPAKNKGGRPRRDPLEVLRERLRSTTAAIARQGLMAEEDVVLAVRGAYRDGAAQAAAEAEPAVAEPVVAVAGPKRFSDETQPPPPPPVVVSAPPADRKLIDGPTKALVLIEGSRGWIGEVDVGLFTELRLDGIWLGFTKRTATGSQTRVPGYRIEGCVLVVEGVEMLEAMPGGPEDGRTATPEEYRAYWQEMRRVLLEAGRRLLLDGVTAEVLASYPDRVAAAAASEADRLAHIAAEDADKAERAAFEAAAKVSLREPKGVRVTVVSEVRGGRPYVKEVRILELTYGPWRDGERAEYEYKHKGLSRSGPDRLTEEWGPGKQPPFAILRGQGLGIAEVDEHGFPLDDAVLAWDEVVRKARGCGAEFLVDKLPAAGGFPGET